MVRRKAGSGRAIVCRLEPVVSLAGVRMESFPSEKTLMSLPHQPLKVAVQNMSAS